MVIKNGKEEQIVERNDNSMEEGATKDTATEGRHQCHQPTKVACCMSLEQISNVMQQQTNRVNS